MSTSNASFFGAIKAGDRDRVRQLLAADRTLVDAYDHDEFEATPVAVAATRGDLAMVDLLLQHGADINRKSDWWAGGFAPIHVALDQPGHPVARALIARGATVDAHAAAALGLLDRLEALERSDPAVVHQRGGDGKLPLHFAATPEVAAWLLERGAAIDARDVDHESTAAQHAVRHRAAVARFLVQRGAEADPFMLVAASMIDELGAWLDRRPDELHARVTRERFSAPGSSADHIYWYILGADHTLLHVAAVCNQPESTRLLVGRGLDPAVRGGYDEATPLHVAAWEGSVDAARALLDAGADIDLQSGPRHENEPIGWAVAAGRPEMVALLIERGATVQPWHRRDAAALAAEPPGYTAAPRQAFEACARLIGAPLDGSGPSPT